MKLILLGPPGGGKGTVAKKLREEFKMPVISTGVILREEINRKTKLGEEIKEITSKGELVPDHIILEVIKERIKKKDSEKGYILDGFPRNLEQARFLDELNETIDQVFYFEISFKEIIERLTNRRVCKKCGTNYNLLFNPLQRENTCDLCGGELYQREDDREETIKNRLQVFSEQTLPLKEYYQKKNLLTVVNANSSEQAFLEIKSFLNKKLLQKEEKK